ncbi:MAG TPA: hypothetical protein VJ256_06520 [Dehalococcoidia bacterium]|nr:hypothetical protein [Dehalococcoidia bacterium]
MRHGLGAVSADRGGVLPFTAFRTGFGELVYQRAVPQEHFLRKLRELLPLRSAQRL